MLRLRTTQQPGFTLVEILIVVAILGILAALVAPRYLKASADSKAQAAATTVIAVQSKINESEALTGSFPAAIDPTWFADNALPSNPYDPTHATPILYDTSASTEITHPRIKFIRNNGAFWYNPNNGRFHALVSRQPSNDETLALYNSANSVKLSSFTQTSD